MPLYLLPTLLLYILAVGYSPGPANLYSLACCLRYGRKRALGMWWGLLTGFLIAVTLMALMTWMLGTAFGSMVVWLKYLGAAYMLYLAFRLYQSASATASDSSSCSFLSGMIVQLTNAKMLLFDLAAFSTFVLPYSNRLLDLLLVGWLLVLAGPMANLLWIFLGEVLSRLLSHHRRLINATMSLLLVLCAVLILL